MYVTDMGLAKVKTGCATMTQVQLLGTPYYAAPETYDGVVGTPSDVWALRLVLLELYGGKHAWGEIRHQNQLMKLMIIKQLPKLNHLDESRQKICEACLNFDAKARKSIRQILQLIRTST